MINGYRHPNSTNSSTLTRYKRKVRRNKHSRIKQQPIQQLIAKAKVDYTEILSAPPTVISINDQPIATLGNFSLVKGPPKSKKTFKISLVIGHLQPSTSHSTIKVDQTLGDFDVLYFDTEQSKHKVIEVAQRICRLNGVDMPYSRLKVFALRPFSVQKRINIIESVIYSSPQAKLVVIDGARDLVYSINSEEEASKISNLFLKWTAEKNIHIMTVLHQNKSKNNSNARGHLGTELVNKAETTISVKANSDETSTVSCSFSRELEFDPFKFQINETGLPEVINSNTPIFQADSEAIINYSDPQDMPKEKRDEIVQYLSENADRYKYQELVTSISEAVQQVTGSEIGESVSKRYKVFFEENKQIKKHGKDRSPSAYYTVNI